MAARSGSNGERPAAMRSTFMKSGQSASRGRNSSANVVFPAPFGPAMIKIRFSLAISHSRCGFFASGFFSPDLRQLVLNIPFVFSDDLLRLFNALALALQL